MGRWADELAPVVKWIIIAALVLGAIKFALSDYQQLKREASDWWGIIRGEEKK
jgi:hypothetical protein